VALLSSPVLGNPLREKAERVRDAVDELDQRKVLGRGNIDRV
jgi:hypothetical protein